MLNIEAIKLAKERIEQVVIKTPLEYSERLSQKFKAEIYLKREDLQPVRSYKIRGAYNLIASLNTEERQKGVICASAGNHAQGFAFACNRLEIKGMVYMPEVTPRQKIEKVRKFGGDYVEIVLHGKTFDEAYLKSREVEKIKQLVFVHPFDDERTIAGQGTVALELSEQLPDLEIVIAPIGGGGLISGLSTYLKNQNPDIKIYGADPEGAAKAYAARENNAPITLEKIDTFVDGAAVKRIGELTFYIIKSDVEDIVKVPEGKVCTTMIELYQNEGIITEPAGALATASLDILKNQIEGKKVVVVISGGNNDISRYPEIMERSLVYEGLKHYFLIEFAQKPGQLKLFLEKALGANDDIVRFEYLKKTNKEFGPALVGVELTNKNDLSPFLERMQGNGIKFRKISPDEALYQYLV